MMELSPKIQNDGGTSHLKGKIINSLWTCVLWRYLENFQIEIQVNSGYTGLEYRGVVHIGGTNLWSLFMGQRVCEAFPMERVPSERRKGTRSGP